ncbi:substrate-binding domain-containing protein [Paraburkholderia phenazinium]|uniref:substrate-binding domain-containing protein n=1 Tax=Paraburkholderia phenazinium TaxID=60549 RepID=UPI00158E5222|nr:substrate-binding domain-containing protein [Paraburkholderia phenazinium]
MRKFNGFIGLAAAAMSAALYCNMATAQDGKYRIAVMPFAVNEYMSRWVKEMQQHPLVKDGTVKMTVLDGKYDAMVQSNQFDTAITQKFDAIIVAPVDFQAAAAPIARAAAAHIPVVGSVTTANSDKLFAYVGTNDVEGGRLETQQLVNELKGKGNIVILEGPIGNSPQLMRRKGIDAVLAANPGIKVLASKPGNWSRAEGLSVTEDWLTRYGKSINGIISQNDAMSLGAIEALKLKQIDPTTMPVVSIDGDKGGQMAVKQGDLYTLYKDAHCEGQGAMDLAIRAVAGPSYQPKSDCWSKTLNWKNGAAKQYDVPWVPLTKANIDQYLQ